METHAEKLLKCELCDYRTNSKTDLKDHIMQNHTMERPFKCDQCDYAATNAHKLKQHKAGFNLLSYCHDFLKLNYGITKL